MKLQTLSAILLLLAWVGQAVAVTKSKPPMLKSPQFSKILHLKPYVRGHIPVSFGIAQKENLTTADKQRALDMINAVRLKLALGNETTSWDGANGYTPMPSAANMQAVTWDDKLADYAQNWASKCISGHSPLNSLQDDRFKVGHLGENLCGGISFLEKDMYGEVQWWNYKKFACKPNSQCGHYLTLVAWGMNHVGCGWKVCEPLIKGPNSIPSINMVCVHGGYISTSIVQGKKRLPYQHEYLKGPPCSACEQGWDYCMGGGLCATKQQCESDPSNECTCNHNAFDCFSNGGVFDEKACTCTCPKNRMGINCAEKCANSKSVMCAMDCYADMQHFYYCKKTCNGCGVAKGPAYNFYFVKNKMRNRNNIRVRHKLENPDSKAEMAVAEGLTTKPMYGKCKNIAADSKCEYLFYRNYCHDMMMGDAILGSCGLSCNKCPKKKKKVMINALIKAKLAKKEGTTTDLDKVSLKGFEVMGAGKKASAKGWLPASAWGTPSGKKSSDTPNAVPSEVMALLAKAAQQAEKKADASIKKKKAADTGASAIPAELMALMAGAAKATAGTATKAATKKKEPKKAATGNSAIPADVLAMMGGAEKKAAAGTATKAATKKKEPKKAATGTATKAAAAGTGDFSAADFEKLFASATTG